MVWYCCFLLKYGFRINHIHKTWHYLKSKQMLALFSSLILEVHYFQLIAGCKWILTAEKFESRVGALPVPAPHMYYSTQYVRRSDQEETFSSSIDAVFNWPQWPSNVSTNWHGPTDICLYSLYGNTHSISIYHQEHHPKLLSGRNA